MNPSISKLHDDALPLVSIVRGLLTDEEHRAFCRSLTRARVDALRPASEAQLGRAVSDAAWSEALYILWRNQTSAPSARCRSCGWAGDSREAADFAAQAKRDRDQHVCPGCARSGVELNEEDK
jgi:hypothetical protein